MHSLNEARANVAATLGIIDIDGQPELASMIDRAIVINQRRLSLKPWINPDRTRTIPLISGERRYTIPGGQRTNITRCSIDLNTGLGGQLLSPHLIHDDITTEVSTPTRFCTSVATGLVRLRVLAGGTGYADGSTITISDPPTGVTAIAHAVVSNGAVVGAVITDTGFGYVSTPTVTVAGGDGAAVLQAYIGEVDTILLDPAPASAWNMHLTYRPVAPDSMLGDDLLIIDPTAVELAAAAQIVRAIDDRLTADITAQANDYLTELQARSRAPGVIQPPVRAIR